METTASQISTGYPQHIHRRAIRIFRRAVRDLLRKKPGYPGRADPSPEVKAGSLLQGAGRACGANQSVGLLENVVVLGLLAGKEADQHECRAKQQAHQHDLAVGTLVGGVKGPGHPQAIQLEARRAISLGF